MTIARLIADLDFPTGEIDPRLFGSFVEHIGRCVYTGIFEPGHPEADAHGFRRDVLALVRELGVKVTCLHEGAVLAEGTIDEVSSNERVVEVYLGR